MKLRVNNPKKVAAPLGPYSHAVETPSGRGLIFLSGQVPVALDGSVGSTLAEQAEQVYLNISTILAANGAGIQDVVKLVTYLVEDDVDGVVARVRSKYFGEHRPASTMLYVRRLVDPNWKIEVEAIALSAEQSTSELG